MFKIFIILYVAGIIVLIICAPVAFLITILISLFSMVFGFINAPVVPDDKDI